MASKDYFRNLAQMSRRIAGNMTDPVIVDQLLAIGEEYDLERPSARLSRIQQWTSRQDSTQRKTANPADRRDRRIRLHRREATSNLALLA
jgi:hypothetical protein